jgi:hypothetical protein
MYMVKLIGAGAAEAEVEVEVEAEAGRVGEMR